MPILQIRVMEIWIYDNTFEGLLSLVFECYEHKVFPDRIERKEIVQTSLFGNSYHVITDEEKAKRVWKSLQKRITERSFQMLYYTYLSEFENVEILILKYIRKTISSPINIEINFSDPDVLEIFHIQKKVTREADRIRMFVRFQKTADGLYYASFDPQYNVLPLVTDHFEKRFADQQWVIYDTRRLYGYYYNLKSTNEIRFEEHKVNRLNGSIDKKDLAPDEMVFQRLWKSYFKEMCIKERINPKLHVQLLPKRYWKYLIEKQ
jgi:probable DNA metabolism protein